MNGKIYILTDGSNIRYVGQTIRELNSRLALHISSINRERNHKRNWVKSLLDKGIKPSIILVEDGIDNREDLNEAEVFYISKFRELGCELTNQHIGGSSGNTGFMKKGMFFGIRPGKGYKQSEYTIEQKVLNNPLRTPIYQLDKNDNIIKEFISQREAAKELNLNQGNINMVLSGLRKTTGGFKFKYKNSK